jgi:hypothetical protein
MKRIAFLTTALALVMSVIAVRPAQAHEDGRVTLDQVRDATEAYHRVGAAKAAGYSLVPGLDYCFDNPGVGGMGYHYINVALLDNVIEPLKPEAMVYNKRANGKLELGAVEYIVPAAGWDAVHSQPPTLFGQTFGLEQALGVYELHAWIWKHNPSGVFFEWNPRLSCHS